MKNLNLKIEGMHCKNCAALIRLLFEDIEGIAVNEVDYHSGEAVVQFDENKISQEKIIEIINETHYKVIAATES